jgi:hypothetical protein
MARSEKLLPQNDRHGDQLQRLRMRIESRKQALVLVIGRMSGIPSFVMPAYDRKCEARTQSTVPCAMKVKNRRLFRMAYRGEEWRARYLAMKRVSKAMADWNDKFSYSVTRILQLEARFILANLKRCAQR